jgi:hypothetical protein
MQCRFWRIGTYCNPAAVECGSLSHLSNAVDPPEVDSDRSASFTDQTTVRTRSPKRSLCGRRTHRQVSFLPSVVRTWLDSLRSLSQAVSLQKQRDQQAGEISVS